MLHGSGTEGVCRTEIYFLAGFLKLVGQFADGGCLAYTIDTHDKDDIGLVVSGEIPAIRVGSSRLGEELGYLVAQDTIEFRGGDIFVTRHTLFDSLDNLQGRIYAHIRGDEHFLQVVEDFIIDLRFAGYCARQLRENTLLGLFQTLVERLLFLLVKQSE